MLDRRGITSHTTRTSFRAADGQGTTGSVEFVFHSPELHIIVSEGVYDGPMYPVKLRGQCVLVMKTTHVREQNGRVHVVSPVVDLDFGTGHWPGTFQR